ncbi:MAG: ABC transporter permease [Lachnospiraceae bacterium]|nr:ABC transporter permease [Lachnospiraceae bacterium]
MKRTHWLEGLRNIQKKKAAFLTLILIIVLGLGGFCSSQIAESSMKAAGRDFFVQSKFKDYDVLSSTGITQEDLEEYLAMEDVIAAEGRYTADALFSFSGTDKAVKTFSLTETVSVPQLAEGRLPANPEECLIDPDLLEDSGAAIGDRIRLEGATASAAQLSGEYVITGTAYHPDYLRRDTVYPVILMPEVYDPQNLGIFESASLRVHCPEETDPFSDAYFERTAEAKDAIREKAEVLLDRRSNAGFTEYGSTIAAVSGAGACFGILFLLVTAIECFSTVSLLVEEQKKLLGIEKAFGFRPAEVLFRYLMFGAGAAVTGCLLGLALSLALAKTLLWLLEQTELYVFPAERLVFSPWILMAVSFAVIATCALTAVFACRSALRSSADALLKGESSASVWRRNAKKRDGSLYGRLILRNALREKGRVAVTVIVTAASCMLIGSSITVKLAYDGMNARQLTEIWLYDLRVDLASNTGAEVMEQLEKEMDALGVTRVSAGFESFLFENEDRLDGTLVLSAPPDVIGQIIGLTVPATGMTNVPDDSGILLQYRMGENLALQSGDSLTLLDPHFQRQEAGITGFVQNYQKRIIALTPAYYLELFREEAPQNSYFVWLNGLEDQTFKDRMLSVSENLGFERADSFYEQYRAIAFMYDTVVLAVTVIALCISFVILINLAAIFVSKRKKELIIMRINGFSLARTRGMLAIEAAAATLLGMILGTLAGIPVGGLAIRFMETPDVMFVREVQPLAWIIAVVVEGLFAVLIYGIALKRVKSFSLTELGEAV